MAWRDYREVKVKPSGFPKTKPRYSLTSDILSFRRCPRQYGFFGVRGYVPAHRVQLFYGTVIHEVLDRAHHHYGGFEDPKTQGKVPTDEDILSYYNEVEKSLKARGVRAINRDLKDRAQQVLKRFNRIEGPRLYPRVIDTEHRVQGDRETHIIDGVIDVLVDAETGSRDPSQVEIWDYKGARQPDEAHSEELDSYKYQMLVYAALYKIRNGCLPKRAVLYFMNELDNDSLTTTPNRAVYSIDLASADIDRALREFDQTARLIGKCKEANKWDPPPTSKLPTIEDTCAICDLRWSCSSFGKEKQMPYP